MEPKESNEITNGFDELLPPEMAAKAQAAGTSAILSAAASWRRWSTG